MFTSLLELTFRNLTYEDDEDDIEILHKVRKTKSGTTALPKEAKGNLSKNNLNLLSFHKTKKLL
jgi:hypothetical protein